MCGLPVPLVRYLSFPVGTMPPLLLLHLVWAVWTHPIVPRCNQSVCDLSEHREGLWANQALGLLAGNFTWTTLKFLSNKCLFLMSIWVAFLSFVTKRHLITTEAGKFPLDAMTKVASAFSEDGFSVLVLAEVRDILTPSFSSSLSLPVKGRKVELDV